jgi:redox-sensitive bicupin YhaK (pirin superfamily)
MAMVQVIRGRERDLGGFTVRRLLPHPGRQMVGPFIFFDHLGPAVFAPGQGIDVRPHPHTALATVTYLFAGALEHRDSLGTVQEIRPGDVNWMTAGRGIAHSERTPAAARAAGTEAHGIQSWVALPDGFEDVDPAFVHHPAEALPRRDAQGVRVSVIAGHAYGMTSPVAVQWPTLYVEAQMQASSSLEVAPATERALYVVHGEISVAGGILKEGDLGVLPQDVSGRIEAHRASRLMLIGGERFPTPRHIWWNFVASSQERITKAKERWRRNEFDPVPGETEFIPLPP